RSVRILLTSQTPLDATSITHYELPEFTPTFSEKLLKVLIKDPQKKLRVSEIAPELLCEIRSGYDVRLIADLIDENKPVPSQRIELFEAVTGNAFKPSRKIPQSRVCAVAWNLWKSASRSFSSDRALTPQHLLALKNDNIVVPREGNFEFCHDQMRDYLAACWAVRHAPSIQVTLETLNDQAIWKSLTPAEQRPVFDFLAKMVSDDDLKSLARFAADDINYRVALFAAAKDESQERGKPLEIQ
ncbi:MAG TPA: hypothetical protein VLR90_15265, partial [Blastocatellia bacterium]|nr:hypothetical protein [Blastocatellia bacterium]